jgi:hypothetical protein
MVFIETILAKLEWKTNSYLIKSKTWFAAAQVFMRLFFYVSPLR